MDLVKAIDLIYLLRIKGEDIDAWKVNFQTDGSTDESRAYESVPTKDGVKKSVGEYEGTHSLTALLGKNDDLITKIKDQVRKPNPEGIEVWEVDRSDIGDSETIPGEYSYDVVTSFSTSAGADGNVELSIETEIEKGPVRGEVPVTPELLEKLQDLSTELEFEQPTKTV